METHVKPSPIDPKTLKPIMYWAGLTLHACQGLEYGLKVLLVAMAELGFGGFAVGEATDIIEDRTKRTLGQVLRTLQQSVRISDGWRTTLEQALAARNRFVHGFLIESVERMADPATRPDVLADIKRIRSTVLEGDRTLRQMLETIFAYGGSDFGTLMAEVDAEVRRLNTAGEAGHA
jgi:hypothetical protein